MIPPKSPETKAEQAKASTAYVPNHAIASGSGPIDPDLAAIIHAWPTLSEAVRRDVLAVVRVAEGGQP
jgi:hypothetical protein